MQMSNEGILVILFVGLIAGWLAGKVVRGTGFGIIGDIPVGCFVYRWFNLAIERNELPHLRAWYGRLTERPAYRKHVMIEMT